MNISLGAIRALKNRDRRGDHGKNLEVHA